MDSFHMIDEVPLSWETVILGRSFAVREVTEEVFGAVSVHEMRFSLVS